MKSRKLSTLTVGFVQKLFERRSYSRGLLILQKCYLVKIGQLTIKSYEKISIGSPWDDQRLILRVSRYDILKIGDIDGGLCAKNA